MDVIPLIAALGGGGVVGVVFSKVWDQVVKQRETKAAQRRSEIDRAEAAERKGRILSESLHVHRRIIIDAPCLGPDELPTYPDTKGTS